MGRCQWDNSIYRWVIGNIVDHRQRPGDSDVGIWQQKWASQCGDCCGWPSLLISFNFCNLFWGGHTYFARNVNLSELGNGWTQIEPPGSVLPQVIYNFLAATTAHASKIRHNPPLIWMVLDISGLILYILVTEKCCYVNRAKYFLHWIKKHSALGFHEFYICFYLGSYLLCTLFRRKSFICETYSEH